MKNKKQWPRAFTESVIINCILFSSAAFYLGIQHIEPIKKEPIEVSIVSENDLGGGGNGGGNGNPPGPEISAPEKSEVPIPEAPKTVEEVAIAESQLAESVKEQQIKEVPTNTKNIGNINGNANSTGGPGNDPNGGSGGLGGTGTGSGSGSGSGSGTGSGSGPGSGSAKGETRQVAVVRSVKPPYPESLRQKGIEGTVLVRVTIGTDGSVSNAYVLDSSGYETFDSLAVNYAYKWRFTPAKVNGELVESELNIPITFKLQNAR